MWKQNLDAQGYSCVERYLEEREQAVIFFYKIDIGDKVMKDFPIITDELVTDLQGIRLNEILTDEEWNYLESTV